MEAVDYAIVLFFLGDKLLTIPYIRGGQQADRRVSVGRSHLILHWIDTIPKKNTFQSIFQKVHKNNPSADW